MNRIKQFQIQKTSLLLAITLLILSSTVMAAPDSKTPSSTETAAVAEYNIGLKHLDKSRQILIRGDSAFAYNYRATSAAKAKKEYQKAAGRFRQAVVLKADFEEAFSSLGYCLRELGDLDGAFQAFHKSLDINDEYAPAHKYLGETYLAVNDLEKAGLQLEILRKLQPSYADSLAVAIELYRLDDFSKKLERSKRK